MKYVSCYRTNDMHLGALRILELVSVFEIGEREKAQIIGGWYHNIVLGQHATGASPGYKELSPRYHHTYQLKYVSKAEAETYQAFGLIDEFEDGREYSFVSIHFSL